MEDFQKSDYIKPTIKKVVLTISERMAAQCVPSTDPPVSCGDVAPDPLEDPLS